MQPTFLTPDDLANRWNITSNTLSQWRWNGRGPQFLKIGHKIFYDIKDVELFEEQKRHQSTSTYQSCVLAGEGT